MPPTDQTSDRALLRQFATENSEAAFATLVRRHIGLVHSAALRQTGNPHAAEEITQAVFIILARKAGSLGRKVVLSGWLYQTARLTAANYLRTEIRRTRREQEAYMQSTLNEPSGEIAWQQIAPLLETAMGGLNEADRNAIVLRFFENKSMGEIAAALDAPEATVRKRVTRAVERLRKFFTKRGVTLTVAAIAGAVSANSVQAAPVGLAVTVVTATTKGAAVGGSTLTLVKGALKLMAWMKIKTAIVVGAGVLLAAGATTVTVQEIAASRHESWQEQFDLSVLDKLPPQVAILPTLPGQLSHAAGTRNGKLLGIGQSVPDIMMAAFYIHAAQVDFSSPIPQGKYDYVCTFPRAQREALQGELKRKFGLVGHRKSIAADHFVLKVKTRNAPGLRSSSLPFSGSMQNDSYSGHNQSLWSLVDYLAGHLGMVVIDQTGLTGGYDIDFKWDKTPEGLKRVVEEELGLELVPSKVPIEFVIIEDDNHPIVGVGVVLNFDAPTQTLRIVKTIPNSPAAEAGLTPGWVVQKIDGMPANEKTPDDCLKLIRGTAGTKVRLELISPDGTKTNTVELARRKINL